MSKWIESASDAALTFQTINALGLGGAPLVAQVKDPDYGQDVYHLVEYVTVAMRDGQPNLVISLARPFVDPESFTF